MQQLWWQYGYRHIRHDFDFNGTHNVKVLNLDAMQMLNVGWFLKGCGFLPAKNLRDRPWGSLY